jgi:hypothetical protein
MVLLTLAGLTLGCWSGVTTRVWREGGHVWARAGAVAVVAWVAGMGFRFAFALYANTEAGDRAIGRYSAHHSITSGQAWTTALVLMAFAEVLARMGIMQWRRVHAASGVPQPAVAA